MTDDQIDADLRSAVDERLATRLEAARRRRAAREQARAAKNARRTAGLRKRHTAKLARRTDHAESQRSSSERATQTQAVQRGETVPSSAGGDQPLDDAMDATALGRSLARAGTAIPTRARTREETPAMPTTDPPPTANGALAPSGRQQTKNATADAFSRTQTKNAPAAPETSEPPERRKGRRCGWTGKDRFDFGALRLRGALTRLARDPDPAARAAGVRFSDEAAEFLHDLATRADNTTTAAKRAQAKADRILRKVDERLQHAQETGGW